MQPSGHWMELLSEAIEEHCMEAGGGENSVDHFIEWLAEWGRDPRQRQRGLLLLTAHRAKGLEFDHVVVLDGGWDRVGRGEDPDAPRRLCYVAMTRARHTLTLARLPSPIDFRTHWRTPNPYIIASRLSPCRRPHPSWPDSTGDSVCEMCS